MRYWVYSQGLIQGPYHESTLAGVSGFGPDSLVCPEDKAGSQPSDWRRAGSIPALSMLVSPRVLPPAAPIPADVRFSGGPEPWLAPSEDTDPDILAQLDEYWTRYRSGPDSGEPNVGRIENRVFELEQRLQSFDLDQKALLKKLADKEGLLAELLAKLEPLESRLLDAEAAKEQALREMRHEMDRIKEELRRKEDELRLLRSSPELGGAWQAPSLTGGPMDLELDLAALEKSLGTGELPASPMASAFTMPTPPELVIPPVPGFGEAGLPPSEALPPVSMPDVPRPEPVEGPQPEAPAPVVEKAPVVEVPHAPVIPARTEPVEVPISASTSSARTEVPSAPPPAPVVQAAPEELTIVEMHLAPAAKKLQGEIIPAALLAPAVSEAPARPEPVERAPEAAVTGPSGVMEAVHLPPAPTAPPPPQVTMPRLTAGLPFVPVPKLTPPPPLIPEPGTSGRITSPITAITPVPGSAGLAAKPEMSEVLAKLGKKPDAPSGAVPPPVPPPTAVPGATAAAALAGSAAPAAAAPAPAWMTKIPPLAKLWTSMTQKKKAAAKAPAPASASATAASIPPPAPAPSTSSGLAPAGATVAAPPKAAKKSGQKTFLLVFGLGVVAVGIVFAVFLFRDQRELGPSSAEQAKAVPPMETGLPAKAPAANAAANPMAAAPAPAAAPAATPASPFPTAETAPAQQAPQAAPAPAAQPAAPKPAFQLPPGADALQLTKNYSLGPGRGSLGLYLTKQFLASGSDELMEDWSSSEMQSGVYLVEYKVLHLLPDGRAQRLSNYIFEVDVRKKTVAGYNSGARMILGAPQAAAPQ